MGTIVRLLQAREGGLLLLGSPFPCSGGPGGGATAGRRTVAFAAAGNNQDGGGRDSNPSRPSSTEQQQQPQQQKEKKRKAGAQRPRGPSVLEVQRAIGIADGDDSGAARADEGRGSSGMLDFWASTPIGQAESPPEKKLREVGEWLVDRTESRGLLGQRILMAVSLYVLPVWVLLLLLASGAVSLPFSVPFLDDLLS